MVQNGTLRLTEPWANENRIYMPRMTIGGESALVGRAVENGMEPEGQRFYESTPGVPNGADARGFGKQVVNNVTIVPVFTIAPSEAGGALVAEGVDPTSGLGAAKRLVLKAPSLERAIRAAQTGARTLDATHWDEAERVYNTIRSTDDVATIAKNIGWRESRVARVKNHLFHEQHILDVGVSRFDADPYIVNAWRRLQEGVHNANDVRLMNHELFESRFERMFRVNYRTAHDAAIRSGRTWEWAP